MDEVLKRRVIGAVVLIGLGVLIPIIVVRLAQPSAPPTGESVRVYEITASGEARPVEQDSDQTSATGDGQASGAQADAAPPQPAAGAEPEAAPPPASSAPHSAPAPEPAAQDLAQPEPAPEPEPRPAPAPKPQPTREPPAAAQPPAPAIPSPPPPAATAEKPYFVVQVGSFGDESNAAGLTQKLQRDFPVYYRAGEANGKQLYRVQVGPFDSRESADIVAARLRDRGLKTQTLSLP